MTQSTDQRRFEATNKVIGKINNFNARTIELFEQRFTRTDFENKVRGTKSFMELCTLQAIQEWNKRTRKH